MDPFYNDRRFYYQPGLNRHHYPYPVPLQQSDPTRQTPAQPKRAPKVVQIPIHFVGSNGMDRSGSAVKIQKVFRGFLVRKCVKKIREIESHVDEIEAKLASVRGDEKERLRMIEGLMSLLFKLDSIKGFDLGVRAYRKAVTRRVIALQERIDSIVAVTYQENAEVEDDETDDLGEFDGNCEGNGAVMEDGRPELAGSSGDSEECSENLPAIDSTETRNGAVMEDGRSELAGSSGNSEECSENLPVIDSTATSRDDDEIRVSKMCSSAMNPDVCVQGEDSEEIKTKREDDDVEVHGVTYILEHQKKDSELKSEDSRKDRELLERIMKDNEEMMKMLTQLCEKNESQSKMLTVLAHRVELLEKVFVCERLRKIKNSNKKKNASGLLVN